MVGRIIRKLNELMSLFDSAKLGEKNGEPYRVYTEIIGAIDALESRSGRADNITQAKGDLLACKGVLEVWAERGYQQSFAGTRRLLERVRNSLEAYVELLRRAAA
jgi:hypothetical protein